MQETDISDIEAAVQALVRQAYELGRSHALRKVVDVLNADRPVSEQLALMGPAPAPSNDVETNQESESLNMEDAAGQPEREKLPWWAWRVR